MSQNVAVISCLITANKVLCAVFAVQGYARYIRLPSVGPQLQEDGAVPVSFLKTDNVTEKEPGLPEPETAARTDQRTDWVGLVWLTLVVAAGLTTFERLEHYLFPQLNSPQHQAVPVCVGTIAAVMGTYY